MQSLPLHPTYSLKLKLFDYIIAIVRLILAISGMAAYYLYFKILRPFKREKLNWGLEIQNRYCRYGLKVFGARVTMEGNIPTAPALVVSNHRSLLDPLVIVRYVRALGVAKGEIESYPIMGKAVKETGVIYVHRDDVNSRAKAKDSIVQSLENGFSVLIFPEGTVSGERGTLPFKRGSFVKSVEAKVPVVPIALIYNDARHHWFKVSTLTYFFSSFGWHTPNVHMVIGDPINLSTAEERMNAARDFINTQLMTSSFCKWTEGE